ncbi:hypothetical protein AB0M39_41175, partial [Streptomyces sp. NPDC051907]|uniref:hypothetical protein n=1 Tax=Streptomyces sp. NPDC051907 TaxID=3155284 RepID=UPI003441B400
MPQYPTARDLMESLGHCSACADTSPEVDDGFTECCTKRFCNGADPELAQGPCCEAVAERLEKEAAEGGAPARTVDAEPVRPPARPVPRRRKPSSRRSAQTDETQDLPLRESDANLVSHQGAASPQPDAQEPPMPVNKNPLGAEPFGAFARRHGLDYVHTGEEIVRALHTACRP